MSKSIKSLMSFYLKNINTFWMSKPYPNINFKTFMNKKKPKSSIAKPIDFLVQI